MTSWLMKLFIVTFVSLLSYASAEKNKHCKLQFIPFLFFELLLLLLLFDDVFQSRLHIMHIRQHFVGKKGHAPCNFKGDHTQIYFTTQFFMKNLFFGEANIALRVMMPLFSPFALLSFHVSNPSSFSCVYSQGSIRRRSILVPSGKAAETLIVLFFYILFFSFALFSSSLFTRV